MSPPGAPGTAPLINNKLRSSSTRTSFDRGISGSSGKFSLSGMGSGGVRRGQVGDDSENLNPEDVHRSLRSTANAIQNYSFDYSPARFGGLDETRMGKLDLLDSSKGSPNRPSLQ